MPITCPVLPQTELQAAGFFNDFLLPDGRHWGVNAYAHDGRRHLGDLRIWLKRTRANFDDDSVAVLRLVYPALVQALSRSTDLPALHAAPSRDELAGRLMRYAALPRREAEVAALASERLTNNDIARALGLKRQDVVS